MKNAVVILSGGLDSTTLLHHLLAAGYRLKALSVDYGQRHARELNAATAICRGIGVEQKVVDLSSLADLFGQNSLTDISLAVPEGPYQAGTIGLTTVPNRNMILISLAIGWAISLDFDAVAVGIHAGVHTNYADCKPPFAEVMDAAAHICDDRKPIAVLAPFVTWDKAAIVRRAVDLGAPLELTWSCYRGGEKHCGRCSTCVDRIEAFQKYGLVDPVEYEARTFA